MPCLNYFNFIRNKIILSYGLHCFKSKIGRLKHIGLTRNLSSHFCRKNFIPFEEMIEERRSQARKSIIIEIGKNDSSHSVQALCSKFGNIKNILEFRKPERMILIEFDDENSMKEMFCKVEKNSNGEKGTIKSPFLKLYKGKKLTESEPLRLNNNSTTTNTTVQLDNSISKALLTSDIVNGMKSECNTVSEQIQYSYDVQRMRDLSWRLRFLTCRKIEWALPRSLSHSRVIPFGSSVNTFGHNNCDLDMIIDFSSSHYAEDTNFPLKFQNKSNNRVEKSLEVVATLLWYYMPGFENILKIPQATVPIVKCKEIFTGLDCDITIYNMSAHFMSEILYLYGCSDPRVRPLVFCVRLWAKEKRLTRKEQPGMWFSNFTMTILVLFFLMNTNSAAVIPSLSAMEKLSNKSFSCDGIRCSYTRNVNNLSVSENTQSLEELLLDFFHFYASFDNRMGISLISGSTIDKTFNTALHVQNPLELERNISKAVRYEHLEAFKEECLKAITLLSESDKTSHSDSWGLSVIFDKNINVSPKRTSLNLKSLFQDSLNENQSFNQMQGMSSKVSSKQSFERNWNFSKARRTNKKINLKGKSKSGKFPSYHF